MPFVQVDLERSLMAKQSAISNSIHQAFIEALGTAPDDKFQIFRPHDAEDLVYDPGFWGVERRGMVSLHITMVHLHDVNTKRALFRALAAGLVACGIRHEDLFVSIVENGHDDWYPGKIRGE